MVSKEDYDKAKFFCSSGSERSWLAPVFMSFMLLLCCVLILIYAPWVFIIIPLAFLGFLLVEKITNKTSH